MKKISIIHPSRSRAEQADYTAAQWFNKSDGKFEYILSIDETDPELPKYKELFNTTFNNCGKIQRIYPKRPLISDNKSAIEAINNAAKIATGDLLIVVSDDFDCPEHWDTLLLDALNGKSDFIVKTQDGLQPTLITLPIMDRVYYNRFGYIYHPDYLHMHCDEEMTIVGHMLGKVINLDLLFSHNHYTTGKMAMDAINVKNNATWAHGQSTLDRRAKTNFGIENPLVKREEIQWR